MAGDWSSAAVDQVDTIEASLVGPRRLLPTTAWLAPFTLLERGPRLRCFSGIGLLGPVGSQATTSPASECRRT